MIEEEECWSDKQSSICRQDLFPARDEDEVKWIDVNSSLRAMDEEEISRAKIQLSTLPQIISSSFRQCKERTRWGLTGNHQMWAEPYE